MRTNKTKNNLRKVWEQLDNASGEIYNALESISRMTDLPDTIKRQVEMIDVSRIDMLKNEIEELIQTKKENN